MKKDDTGVLIKNVDWNSSASDYVKKGDVIISIDGHKIANDSTVEFRENERVGFEHFSDLKQVGHSISLNILRDGKQKKVTYKLRESDDDTMLVPYKKYDVLPEYFIFGGIVFSPLNEDVLCAWEECEGPAGLVTEMEDKLADRDYISESSAFISGKRTIISPDSYRIINGRYVSGDKKVDNRAWASALDELNKAFLRKLPMRLNILVGLPCSGKTT